MIGSDVHWIYKNPYYAYSYSYPHKSAYGAFPEPQKLEKLWQHENKDNLFLYLHVPFCEMRCGFCNLFTTVSTKGGIVQTYLEALRRQIEATQQEIGNVSFSRFALGGGTPTFLTPDELGMVFELVENAWGVNAGRIPTSIETSPQTTTPDRLAVLSDKGVERVSIGIQSFIEDETRALGRPQKREHIEAALQTVRDYSIPKLNIDLIYGAALQTPKRWLWSLQKALIWEPEEIYLYPLYVRPQTGLDGRAQTWDEQRLELYRIGRDYLLGNGYRQVSMRMFVRGEKTGNEAPVYCCQEDGMLGLGAGARSYTDKVHYSFEYAVKRFDVLSILHDYCEKSVSDFHYAYHGVSLNNEERMRRDLIKSLLHADGLDLTRFEKRFGKTAFDICPELAALVDNGFLSQHEGYLSPTPSGLEYADAIGPWLASTDMKNIMYQDLLYEAS